MPRGLCRSSAFDVAHEVRDVGEPRVEELAERAGHAVLVERGVHAAQPGIAHRDVDGHVCVAHAQPRVPVLPDVVVGTAEPADQEHGEAIAGAAIDLAVEARRRC